MDILSHQGKRCCGGRVEPEVEMGGLRLAHDRLLAEVLNLEVSIKYMKLNNSCSGYSAQHFFF